MVFVAVAAGTAPTPSDVFKKGELPEEGRGGVEACGSQAGKNECVDAAGGNEDGGGPAALVVVVVLGPGDARGRGGGEEKDENPSSS